MTPAPDTGRTADENELREALATELASVIYGGGMISPLAFATRLLSGPLAPILQKAAISPRGRFIDGVEDLPSEEALTERGSFALPDSVRYDIEREARNIVNVFAPDAPPALLQSIKAALLRAEKRRIRDVRAARVSNERPEAEDPKGLSPSGRQCDGEAGTPKQSAEQEAATLRARLQEAEKADDFWREVLEGSSARWREAAQMALNGDPRRLQRLLSASRSPVVGSTAAKQEVGDA